MSDLGWRAEGIARATAAGGIELEVYRRPGFKAELAVRRSGIGGGSSGFVLEGQYDEDIYVDPTPEMFKRRRRSR